MPLGRRRRSPCGEPWPSSGPWNAHSLAGVHQSHLGLHDCPALKPPAFCSETLCISHHSLSHTPCLQQTACSSVWGTPSAQLPIPRLSKVQPRSHCFPDAVTILPPTSHRKQNPVPHPTPDLAPRYHSDPASPQGSGDRNTRPLLCLHTPSPRAPYTAQSPLRKEHGLPVLDQHTAGVPEQCCSPHPPHTKASHNSRHPLFLPSASWCIFRARMPCLYVGTVGSWASWRKGLLILPARVLSWDFSGLAASSSSLDIENLAGVLTVQRPPGGAHCLCNPTLCLAGEPHPRAPRRSPSKPNHQFLSCPQACASSTPRCHLGCIYSETGPTPL